MTVALYHRSCHLLSSSLSLCAAQELHPCQSELFRYIMAYSKDKFYEDHGSAPQVRLGRCAPLYVVCLLEDRDCLFNGIRQVPAIA